jgi:predicted amino acid-binding ACT domain protein
VSHPFTLTLSCQERPGIVSAVSSFLFEQGCDIVEHQQFDDAVRGQLFLRTAFACAEDIDADRLSAAFGPVAGEFAMTYQVTGNQPQRVLVMVSRLGHCLNDLIFRWRAGSLGAELVAVVSNHEDLRPMAEAAGLPFCHVPVTPADHRAGDHPHRPHLRPARAGHGRPGRRGARALPGGPLAQRTAGPAERPQHRCVPLTARGKERPDDAERDDDLHLGANSSRQWIPCSGAGDMGSPTQVTCL